MPVLCDPVAYHPSSILVIDLSRLHWRATGMTLGEDADSHAMLSAIIQIGGADHHLTALEVTAIDGAQSGAPGAEADFNRIVEYDGREGKFETVAIEGRRYVLTAMPFRVCQ